MLAAIVALTLAVAANAYVNPNSKPVITEALIKTVEESGAPWTAGHNKFSTWTLGDAKKLCGTKLDDPFIAEYPRVDAVMEAIPASFNSSVQWAGCIHPIRNQEQCGSCWAFGATEALSDRLCIFSNGSINVVLAPQDLVSCDTANGNAGCNGGYPIYAWDYMVSPGIVTDHCYPYTSQTGVTGTCLLSGNDVCPSGNTSWAVYNAASAYAVAPNVAAIQTEIYTNGPIEVAFDVYEDFFAYTGGVYVHKTGALAGGHAVKMIGWGTLNGVAYWECSNSWGADWGLNGFFLIKRGVDECGIESNGVAGLPDVSTL
jgi:cathepsin B